MLSRSRSDNQLENFDPEPERTLHRNRRVLNQATTMAEGGNMGRLLRDYANPDPTVAQSSIVRPRVEANSFEIKPAVIHMLSNIAFEGDIESEDPRAHLENFLEICDTFKYNGVTEEAIRLRLFPFSLKFKAKEWLKNQPPNTYTTWQRLSEDFLSKFCPPAKTAQLRNAITSFVQGEDESLYQAWERFKELKRKCPHHSLPSWLVVQSFYNGMRDSDRSMVDAAAGGSVMNKTDADVLVLFEDMASNSYRWNSRKREIKKPAGVYELDGISVLNAKVDALTKKLEGANMIAQPQGLCELCQGMHPTSDCKCSEQVHFVQNYNRQPNNPYSNSYNPGWRNHPNFSWGGQNQGNNNPPGFQQQRPQQQQQHHPQQHQQQQHGDQRQPAAWEVAMEKLVVNTTTRFEKIESALGQIATATRNLEVQMGQLASTVSTRLDGALPSQTEKNPREHCQAVMVRSGKMLEESTPKVDDSKVDKQVEEEREVPCNPVVRTYVPPIPFPQRLLHNRLDKKHEKFLNLFRQLHINIPFADALSQMPAYVKFLKELLSNRKKLEDIESITLNEECSAVIQRKIPDKLKDPGSFSLFCELGNLKVSKALCDLGASVSLMPLSVYKKIGCGELKKTRMSLQLADRTIKYPMGILEDVLVKVGKFYIPCDFVVLDMAEDSEVPIILGRPFLATAGTVIDVRAGKLSLNVGDEKVEFDLNKAMEHSPPKESCCVVTVKKVDVKESTKEQQKPSLEGGNEKNPVRDPRKERGDQPRLKRYLKKMLKRVKAKEVPDPAG